MSNRGAPVDLRLLVLLARVLLSAVLALALAVPVLSYTYARSLVLLGAQGSVPDIALPAADLATYRAYPSSAPAFVVLGYDDLSLHARPASSGVSRTIDATTFARQLAMLRAAGFASVTAGELQDYLTRRTALPRHAVLIAFDGGRERDWTLGDRVLARYGFRAVVFIDPEEVSRHAAGYLSWTQLAAMTSSGRWSVGLDISGAAESVALGPGRPGGPALLEHEWLPEAQRVETAAEYQVRVRGTLMSELETVVAHGLGRPRVVEYPFGPGYPLDRTTLVFDELTGVVNSTAGTGLLGIEPDTAVTSVYRSERLLPMMQIYNGTTPEDLFARIEAAAS